MFHVSLIVSVPVSVVHNHTFIHLRGVCADVLLDGAPHGHHAGGGAGK